jgi:hypothetical protein
MFMAMYSFVPPFHETKFCGVASCVFDKLGYAAGVKKFYGPLAYAIQLWIHDTVRLVTSTTVHKL